jgi:glycosyltransferase involved in cell wall biosynthesis
MKRVLFLNQTGVLGGAELYLLDVARCYRESSTVILFADGPLRNRLEAAGVSVRVLPSPWALEGVRGGAPRPTVRGVAEVMRLSRVVANLARSCDLLYANSHKALLVACTASLLAHRPVLWALHDILDLEHFSRTAIRINIILANRFTTRVIANSRATADALLRWGARKGKIHVVYCGFDPIAFQTITAADVALARAELGLGPGPVVGVFGRLTAWKGQHVALDALPMTPGVQALFVGEPFGDEDYASDLRRRAEELGVKDRVHFLGFRDDVPRLMRLVDVVLHTSVAPEPFGRVIVEGMLAGKPVIAADGGGVPEIVEDGVTGVLVRPGDSRQLGAAVQELLGRSDRGCALGAAGRARAIARFGLQEMLREINRHVDEVARQ